MLADSWPGAERSGRRRQATDDWYLSCWVPPLSLGSQRQEQTCTSREARGAELRANICKRADGDGSLLGGKRLNRCAWERAQIGTDPGQGSILKYSSKGLVTRAPGERFTPTWQKTGCIWNVGELGLFPVSIPRVRPDQCILMSSLRIQQQPIHKSCSNHHLFQSLYLVIWYS